MLPGKTLYQHQTTSTMKAMIFKVMQNLELNQTNSDKLMLQKQLKVPRS